MVANKYGWSRVTRDLLFRMINLWNSTAFVQHLTEGCRKDGHYFAIILPKPFSIFNALLYWTSLYMEMIDNASNHNQTVMTCKGCEALMNIHYRNCHTVCHSLIVSLHYRLVKVAHPSTYIIDEQLWLASNVYSTFLEENTYILSQWRVLSWQLVWQKAASITNIKWQCPDSRQLNGYIMTSPLHVRQAEHRQTDKEQARGLMSLSMGCRTSQAGTHACSRWHCLFCLASSFARQWKTNHMQGFSDQNKASPPIRCRKYTSGQT